jgi:hypothetical protein
MNKKILILTMLVLVSFCFAETEESTGTFTIDNVPPGTPYNWSNFTTHYKNQNFSWLQPTDDNGDDVTTYVCITNDTDDDSCSVVDTELSANQFWYKFDQSELFWDYLWGTVSRTYYVKLTPNDGTINGTANDTISFTLYDNIPTISGQTSNANTKGNVDVGENVLFTMTSHSDIDTDDNHSLVVCTTNQINTSGECVGTELCNEYKGTYSDDVDLDCSYTAQQTDNTSNTAYFFVCDCPPFDEDCPGQCSAAASTTFYVNHKPVASNVDILPDNPTSSQNLTCDYDFSDSDGDSEGTSTFKWYKYTGSWSLTGLTTKTISYDNTTSGETWICEVTPVDEFGLAGDPVNSTNETISNSAPLQPTNFSIQDGATNYDTTAPFETHDVTPTFNWTNYDEDGDTINVTVCIATNESNRDAGICDAYQESVIGSEITINSGLDFSGTSRTYYVRLTPNDGTVNGTALDVEFNLINSLPNTPSDLSPTTTHSQTPTLSWTATDDDDGSNGHWPADTLTYHVRVGTSYGDGTYLNSDDADKTGEAVTTPIPWGTPGAEWANQTVYVSIWTTDGNTDGISEYYNTTLTLYDFLPDVTKVEMTDIGSYSECTNAASGCALNPVEGNNTNVAVRITANDTDADCDTESSAYVYLCTYTSGTCDATTHNYSWEVDNAEIDGTICTYTFLVNKTDGPEFYIPANDSYLMFVNVSSQGGLRTSDAEQDRLWEYGLTKAIDYPSNVTLGDGSPTLNQWNDGTELAVMTNWGNAILNLTWNITDPTSGTDTWVLNGTDMQLDDDNDQDGESGGLAPIYMNATQRNFQPVGGLNRCVSMSCDSGNDETLDTYYHIFPPLGLEAGVYNATILIEVE